MAMPTGTRNSIRVNKATKPMTATASGLRFIRSMSVALFRVRGKRLRVCDQAPGADGDQ